MKTKLLPRIGLLLPLISGLPGCVQESPYKGLTIEVMKCVNKQSSGGKVSTISGPCSIDRRTFDTGNEKGESGKIEGICKVILVKKTVLFNNDNLFNPESYDLLDVAFSGNDKMHKFSIGGTYRRDSLIGYPTYAKGKWFSTEPYVLEYEDIFDNGEPDIILVGKVYKNALSAVLESKMCN